MDFMEYTSNYNGSHPKITVNGVDYEIHPGNVNLIGQNKDYVALLIGPIKGHLY